MHASRCAPHPRRRRALPPGRAAAGAVRCGAVPNRSLGRFGFHLLMAAIVLVSAAIGAAFVLAGAWPVTGFLGADVLLLYLAFRWNYRQGRRAEFIRLDGAELVVRRVEPSGRSARVALRRPLGARHHRRCRPSAESQLARAQPGWLPHSCALRSVWNWAERCGQRSPRIEKRPSARGAERVPACPAHRIGRPRSHRTERSATDRYGSMPPHCTSAGTGGPSSRCTPDG